MVVRYYEDLLRFCSRSVKDADTARDVVQETYARFLASRQAADGTVRQPGAVLHQIARHLLVDQHRRAVVRAHEDLDGLDEADEPIAPTHLQPDALLSSAQSVRAYLSTIESLPPRCREAFVLYVFDGMSHARIAEKMGISCSMVEKHIVRGMVACKLCERSLSADHVPEPSASKP